MVASAIESPENSASVIDVGLYTPWDAARYLRVPVWVFDTLTGESATDEPADPPPEDSTGARLSFRELAALFVRAAAFDLVAVSRPHERDALVREVRHQSEATARTPIPFGARSAPELAAELAAAFPRLPTETRDRLRELFTRRLTAVETANGEPIRIYPPTRDPSGDSPRLLVIDPRVRFGRPTVARTGMPTDVLFERYQAGDSVAILAEDHDLTTDEVEEAIRHEVAPRIVLTRNPLR